MTKASVSPRVSATPTIEIVGGAIAPTLRARVIKELRRAAVGVRTSPVHVTVTFTDVNGPRGGLDVRCAIDVTIPQTPPLHVETLADSDVTAFQSSAAKIAGRIAARLKRRRESGRRPKKYYAARRLL